MCYGLTFWMWFISRFICRLLDSLQFTWRLKIPLAIHFNRRPHHFLANQAKLWLSNINTQHRKFEVFDETRSNISLFYFRCRPQLSTTISSLTSLLLSHPFALLFHPTLSILYKLKAKLLQSIKKIAIYSIKNQQNGHLQLCWTD